MNWSSLESALINDKKLNSSTHTHQNYQKKQLKPPTVLTKPHYSEQPTRTISPPLHKWATADTLIRCQFAHRALRSALWEDCWIGVLTHHASIKKQQVWSRSEAGREGAGRRQQGDRETKAGHGNNWGIWATCHNVHLEKSHFRSAASCCEAISKAMRWGQPQQQQQQQHQEQPQLHYVLLIIYYLGRYIIHG